ncbi:hypothetical protein Tco_0733285 [Tanacetum coccineum]
MASRSSLFFARYVTSIWNWLITHSSLAKLVRRFGARCETGATFQIAILPLSSIGLLGWTTSRVRRKSDIYDLVRLYSFNWLKFRGRTLKVQIAGEGNRERYFIAQSTNHRKPPLNGGSLAREVELSLGKSFAIFGH